MRITAVYLVVLTALFAPASLAQQALDPYEPIGLRGGTFDILPSVTSRLTFEDNASNGGTAASVEITSDVALRSNWSRHALDVDLSGTHGRELVGGSESSWRGSADARLRLDLAGGHETRLTGGYGYTQQSAGDPDTPGGLDARPGVHELTSSASLTGGAGRLRATIAADVGRTFFENGRSAGLPVDQGFRTNTRFGASGRLALRTGGILSPFVEGEIRRRTFDRTVDPNGFRRSATEFAGSTGVAFDGAVLNGEASVGVLHLRTDDAALADVTVWSVDGSLVWLPAALTTVTANLSTSVAPTTTAGSSGTVTRTGDLGVSYAWRPNVTLSADIGGTHETFLSTGRVDQTGRVGVGAQWRLNRNVTLAGSLEHERVVSTSAGGSFNNNSATLELRLAR